MRRNHRSRGYGDFWSAAVISSSDDARLIHFFEGKTMTQQNYQYGFIGAGNMAKGIIGGLLNNGITADTIIASTFSAESGDKLAKDYGLTAVQDNNQVLAADIIILAVKPQILTQVLAAMDTEKLAIKLIISVIAGIPCHVYQQCIGQAIRIVRSMPNMPSMVGHGMTGLYAENCSQADKDAAQHLMQCTGKILWVEKESGIDYVNAISGSGPAYVYGFIHHLAAAGEKLGLSYQDALDLSLQTVLGSTELAAQYHQGTPESMQALINQITSKGGTTFAAMQSFEKDQFGNIIDNAVQACYQRAIELGEQYQS